jgi:hypothetical protein
MLSVDKHIENIEEDAVFKKRQPNHIHENYTETNLRVCLVLGTLLDRLL